MVEFALPLKEDQEPLKSVRGNGKSRLSLSIPQRAIGGQPERGPLCESQPRSGYAFTSGICTRQLPAYVLQLQGFLHAQEQAI